MKRLITLLNGLGRRSVMTLLLLFAINVCWAKGFIDYWVENGSGFPLQEVIFPNSGKTGSVDITLTGGNTYLFQFKDTGLSGNEEHWYKFENSPKVFENTTVNVQMSTSNSGFGKIEVKTTGTYTFTVTWGDDNIPRMSVTFPTTTVPSEWGDLSLCSNAGSNNWSKNSHDLFTLTSDAEGNPVYAKTITVNDYMATQKNQFRFRFWSNGKSQLVSPTSYTQITLDDTDLSGSFSGATGTSDNYYWYVPTVSSGKTLETITITATYKNNQWIVEAKGTAPTEAEQKAFYLIVPKENVGNTGRVAHPTTFTVPADHVAFRLQPNRERNTDPALGASSVTDILNHDLTSLNLKIDGENGQQLRWHEDEIKFKICDEQGKYYRYKDSESTEFNLAGDNHGAANYEDGYGHCDTYYTESTDAGSVKYFRIHKENYATDAKSLTFMFSSQNASHTYYPDKSDLSKTETLTNGNVVNGDKTGQSDTRINKVTGNLIVAFLQTRGPIKGRSSSYYESVIGGANGEVYLVGKTDDRDYQCEKTTERKMTKRYWYGGKNALTLAELGISEEAAADSIVYECTVKKSGDWNNFFLSFSAGNKIVDTNNDGKVDVGVYNSLLRPSVQNQMDAQALEGGIFFHNLGTDGYNDGQAINPALTTEQQDRYVSYKIYFNATYSTYRVQFFDGFYIGGPAVNGGVDGYGSDKRIPMTREIQHGVQCYTYTGQFKNNSKFAFFTNEESYNNNYSEDDNAISSDYVGKMRWATQAPEDNGDYPFYNVVRFNDDVTSDNSLGDGNDGILWALPDGEYTIRFYYGGIYGPDGTSPKNGQALYTVDKKVQIKNVTVNVNGEDKNYGGWYCFSDDCALWMPNGIKAYYAYDVAEKEGKQVVKLRELKDGYIPAHCGVVLRNENLIQKGAVESLNYSPLPTGYDKTQELAEGEKNLLQDCSTADKLVPLNQYEDGYYNYYFTYRYTTNGEKKDVPLNFWKVYPGSKPNKNSAYLHVSKQVTPLAFNVADGNYYIEDASTVALNSKGAYCLLFSIDDVDDSEVTGIRVIRPAANSEASDNVWYNMQGMRVSKPTTAGIYINNGKKVIIK